MFTVVFALCGFLRNETMMRMTMMAMMQVDNQKRRQKPEQLEAQECV